ncbi:hypothetical protein GV054_15490 [Marinomonas mediterranea]|uniref:hypothetical protein n=1 Tax=Marinomonas mediterranea TaxID=119864 RepID=UPI00234B1330|nr:hypothetical protein [Marinomonas mediterranea]WCN14294.1 hypothetical protein GV054_15490 [Marinomonas mediterranea]
MLKRDYQGWVLLEMVLSMMVIAFLLHFSRSLVSNSSDQINELVLQQSQISQNHFKRRYLQITGNELITSFPSTKAEGVPSSESTSFPRCSMCTGTLFRAWAEKASRQ